MRILIPTDFSDLSRYATVMADKFKKIQNAEIHFLHVVEWGDTERDSKGKLTVGEGEDSHFLEERLKMAKEQMNELIEQRKGDSFHIQFGPRTKTILDYARDNLFDLVIMGTHSAHGLSKWLTGTETQHIARYSKVPVLSLMCDRSDLEIKDILIVHDFGKKPDTKIPLLKVLEKGFSANIHLLYVLTGSLDKDHLKEKMEHFSILNELESPRFHFHADRDVQTGITHFNQMNNMDLIIVGTEGRRGLGRLLKSSVAESLINNLYKPVITYHLD